MPNRRSVVRIRPSSILNDILRGSEVQATWTLEEFGDTPRFIRNLIRSTRAPDFESGVDNSENREAPLKSKVSIMAAEMFFQIHLCERAAARGHWDVALKAAWLLGEARGNLFLLATQYRESVTGANKRAAMNRARMKQIMSVAEKLEAGQPVHRNNEVIVDCLFSAVMEYMEKIKGPTCGRSSFYDHWDEIERARADRSP
jgi:hypothetical protein